MTMLETLARAVCCQSGVCGKGEGHDSICHARTFVPDVRAVLLALRSPDEGMVEAMRVAYNDPKTRGLPEAFTAAIDHILTSEAGGTDE